MTKNEKERIIRDVRNRRVVSMIVLIAGLLTSLGANIMESYGLGWIGWVKAGLPPLALFACLWLLELLGRDVPKAKLILSYVVLGSIALMSAYASYVHIYRLCYGVDHDVVFAAITPLMIDGPMILCSVILSEGRKTLARVNLPTPTRKRSAPTTEAARGTVATPPRKRQTSATKIIPATA